MICLIIKIRNSLSTQIIRKFTFGSHGRRFSEIEDMCCVLESAPNVCLLFTFALLLRPWCSWYLPVFATTADNLSLLFHRGLWPFRSCLMVPFTFLPLSSFLMFFLLFVFYFTKLLVVHKTIYCFSQTFTDKNELEHRLRLENILLIGAEITVFVWTH